MDLRRKLRPVTDRDIFLNDDMYFYAERFEWKKEITELNTFTNEDTRAKKRILVFRKFFQIVTNET